MTFAAAPATSRGSAPRNGPIAYSFVEQVDGPCFECQGEEEVTRLPRSWIERVSWRGGRRTRLPCTTGSFESCRDWLPVYSPNGKRLAIVNRGEIVIARPSGDVLRRIPVAAAAVAWSPDGRRIAYTKSYTDGRKAVHFALFVTRLGGTARPVPRARDVDAFGLTWSSRGLLAWERVSGRRGVYVSGPGGGRLRRILPAQDLPRLPRWSYDGRRLAYACGEALCVADAVGNSRRVLTRRCHVEFDLGGGMAWSPDGRYIACTSFSGDLIIVRLHDRKRMIVRRRPPSANFLPSEITWRPLTGTRRSGVRTEATGGRVVHPRGL
jgi:dipeptidyl aminopeptidase/acylaminoacyl peptidase